MVVKKEAFYSKHLVLLTCTLLLYAVLPQFVYSQEGTPRTNDDYMVIGISSRPAMSIPILDSYNYYNVGFGGEKKSLYCTKVQLKK